MNNKLYIFFLVLLTVKITNGQTSTEDLPLRIEIPVKSTQETYRLLPVEKSGVILYYRSIESQGTGQINWYFTLYDTNLVQKWTVPVDLPADHFVNKFNLKNDTAVILMTSAGKAQSSDGIFEIITISAITGNVGVLRNQFPRGIKIAGFQFARHKAFLAGNIPGASPVIMTVDLDSGQVSQFNAGNNENLSLISFTINPEYLSFTSLIQKRISKKTSAYYILNQDKTGNIIFENQIQIPENQEISQAKFVMAGNQKYLLAGTYGTQTANLSGTPDKEPVTTGIFTYSMNGNFPGEFRMYNYLELQNAGNFLAEKDIFNLKKKALKKNKSLNEYSLDFQVIMQDIFPWKNQFITIFEIFAPQYHSETFTDFDFYGRPYTNSYSVFDGYRYNHAIVAAFSDSGIIRWDNGIPFRNLVSMDLTSRLVVHPSGKNNLALYYLSDGIIGSKIIEKEKTIENNQFTPVESMFRDDKMLSETKGKIQRWYNDYSIVSGFQEIKNISLETGNKRLVWFCTKIKYEP